MVDVSDVIAIDVASKNTYKSVFTSRVANSCPTLINSIDDFDGDVAVFALEKIRVCGCENRQQSDENLEKPNEWNRKVSRITSIVTNSHLH
jgi:hypothetical protein